MVVGDNIAVFGDEEAGPLRGRTQAPRTTLGTRATLLRTTFHAWTTEFAEEALQRVIIRQILKAATAKVEGEIAFVGRGRLNVRLDPDGHHGRQDGLHDIAKARHLRRVHFNRCGKRRHGSEGGSRHQHHGGKTGCGGGLQDRLQRTTFVLGHVIYLHLFI